MSVTVLLYAGTDLPSDLVRFGEGGKAGEITHVCYAFDDGWVASAGAAGIAALPAERFTGPAVTWPLPLPAAESAAWVAALRATVGKPYGWRAIGADLIERYDYRLAAHLAAMVPPGLVCSSEGAVTLAQAAPDAYRALFGGRLPALVRPIDWDTAYRAWVAAGSPADLATMLAKGA